MTLQEKWKSQRERKAYLALADGSVFYGYSVAAPVDALGEVVFNTSLSGYEEIISDPSYAGQFVILTAPEIGNVGINACDMESEKFQASGLLIHQLNDESNWRSEKSLQTALIESNIPTLAGIDTRALTLLIREKGTMKGFICASGNVPIETGIERARAWAGLDGVDYAEKVSCKKPYEVEDSMVFGYGKPTELPPKDLHIVLYDFGVKRNILRLLRQAGFRVTVVPAKTSVEDALALKPDGIFYSNGPGDPAAVSYAVENAKKFLGNIPIMGICLGHQILGIACGSKTERLKFGHHGGNHPVKNLETSCVMITSQNHNFSVSEETIDPSVLKITHISLNDHSVEGFKNLQVPMISIQFHPEAAPGPYDSESFFNQCRELIRSSR